jgi:hypothetical protein
VIDRRRVRNLKSSSLQLEGGLMGVDRERPQINMSAIPVAGVGGLGMVGLVAIMAMAFPEARWLLFGGLVGGVLLASGLVLWRRNRRLGVPRGDLPTSLFPSTQTTESVRSAGDEDRPVTPDAHHLVVC